MLELGREALLARIGGVKQAPYRGAAIAVSGARANRVASLEGEVWLNTMHGREVVVLQFA